jgi:glycosyltransferase involved in cell wall biosynthesis
LSDPELTILFVASQLAWRGGIGRVVAGGAAALAARGHRVHAAGPAPGGAPPRLPGVELHPWRKRSQKILQGIDLAPLVRRLAPDVVHFHAAMPHGEVIAALRVLRAGAPRPLLVATPHSSRPYARRRARLGLRAADRVAAPSAWAAAHAQAAGARVDAITVVPAGIELPPAPAPPEARELAVLALGRLAPVKGVDLLIDAFAAAAADRPVWRLWIAGEGAEAAALATRARATACADRIEWLGWVEGDAKTRLLERAAIGAAPSRRESFGAALLEMQAHALACVASDAGGQAELAAGEAARLVPAGDVPALARALAALMDDAAARRTLAFAGRCAAVRYGWETVAERLEAVYAEALRHRPR